MKWPQELCWCSLLFKFRALYTFLRHDVSFLLQEAFSLTLKLIQELRDPEIDKDNSNFLLVIRALEKFGTDFAKLHMKNTSPPMSEDLLGKSIAGKYTLLVVSG